MRSSDALLRGTPLLRPAADRFHTCMDWLDSWHSFSFASHHDPDWMGFGPLRVINDDTIAAGRGFGMHPHRDMEIITVMLEGQLDHRDSLGHAERLRAGEVQCMSAGTGVVHSEINSSDQPCRLLQIWIEPERSALVPSYAQRPFSLGSGWTPLLDPKQRDGALAIARPVRLWRARAAAGQDLPLPPLQGDLGWIQMASGAGELLPADGSPSVALQRGDGLGFAAAIAAWGAACFRAGADGADLLLFALR